jgi:hypothetical protein
MSDKEKQVHSLKSLVEGLPSHHHHLLSRLVHTFEIIVNNEEHNKMNAHALSISFGMNFMKLKPSDDPMKLMQLTTHINKVCELVIQNASRLFDDPPESPGIGNETPNSSNMNAIQQTIFDSRASFSEETLDNNIDDKLLNKWESMNFSRKPKRNIVVKER